MDVQLAVAAYGISGAGEFRVAVRGARLPTAGLDRAVTVDDAVRRVVDKLFDVAGLAEAALAFTLSSLRPLYAEVLAPIRVLTDGVLTVPAVVLLPRQATPVVIADDDGVRAVDCSTRTVAAAGAARMLPPAAAVAADQEVLAATRDRLIDLLRFTRAGMTLAGPVFTIRQLREVYEHLWEEQFDPANFQKRMLRNRLVVAVPPPTSSPSINTDVRETVTTSVSDEPPTEGVVTHTYGRRESAATMTMGVWRHGRGRPAGLYVRGEEVWLDPPLPAPSTARKQDS